MEMRLYLRSLLRWWFLPVALVLLALIAVWTYHQVRDQAKAAATLAVLPAYFPAPGEYIPPQIGFDALGSSEELARRVAATLDDGTTPEQVKSMLSIDIKVNVNHPSGTPLYKVTAKDPDDQRAIRIANVAAAEAQKLFAEVNTPDPKDVRQAFQPEVDQAQQNVDEARAAFARFQSDNNAYALPQRRDQELALIGQLRMAAVSASSQAGSGSATGSGLAAARGELNRLTALLPQYNALTFDQGLAQNSVSRLEQRVSDLQLAGSSASSALADAQSQLADAQAKLSSAQDALTGFEAANGITGLPGAVQAQMTLVNQLTVADASTGARSSTIDQATATEQAELARLESLQPKYDELAVNLQRAESQLSTLEQRVMDSVSGRTMPAQADVKLLEGAVLQSSMLMTLLTYGLGVFLAVFLSLTGIYLLAYFEKVPPSVEEIEQAFGRPVMGRVPAAGS